MSRLSEILGVKEGQEFRYAEMDGVYKVEKEFLYYRGDKIWPILTGKGIYLMIGNPNKIHLIPEKPQLTEQQITAIKGRIAEGTPWAAKDDEGNMTKFFIHKPIFSEKYQEWIDKESTKIRPFSVFEASSHNSIYGFVTDINSPVYLPDWIEESEK